MGSRDNDGVYSVRNLLRSGAPGPEVSDGDLPNLSWSDHIKALTGHSHVVSDFHAATLPVPSYGFLNAYRLSPEITLKSDAVLKLNHCKVLKLDMANSQLLWRHSSNKKRSGTSLALIPTRCR